VTLSLGESREFCRRMAQSHYENFTVASWLLPRELRQPFADIYAYCRTSDDLADEIDSPDESLRLLDWWQQQLQACYQGEARHPVFIALRETIRQYDIPIEPFADLLIAFRQDQRQPRYQTFDDLKVYCQKSANPVGRLVLHLGRCHNSQMVPLSDSICTGLQLVNFWQDVARDYQLGRVYIPRETLDRFGVVETQLAARMATPEFKLALTHEVDRAEEYLNAGWPLVDLVSAELRIDIELFLRGGLAVVRAIRRNEMDVLACRPEVGKWQKARLLAAAWWHSRRLRGAAQ